MDRQNKSCPNDAGDAGDAGDAAFEAADAAFRPCVSPELIFLSYLIHVRDNSEAFRTLHASAVQEGKNGVPKWFSGFPSGFPFFVTPKTGVSRKRRAPN